MARFFRRIAARTPDLVGSPYTFLAAVAAVLVWLATGPIFDWSSSWVLWPATVTSVGAFLLVMLLQYSQNRDTRAIQLKLDEILRASESARSRLVKLERLSDEELGQIEEEIVKLRDEEAADDAA